MECPYCHSELEEGSLWVSRDPVYWYPRGKRGYFPTKDRVAKKGGVRLGGYAPGAYHEVRAWYCRACKRMILFDVE